MPGSTFFFQECPICGRSLQVRIEYLGRLVGCPHCRGEFVASDVPASADRSQPLISRANALLDALNEESLTAGE